MTMSDDEWFWISSSSSSSQSHKRRGERQKKEREILESFAYVTKNFCDNNFSSAKQYPLVVCVCVRIYIYIHTYDTVSTDIHARASNDEFCSRCFVARVGVQKKPFFFFFF